MKAIKYITLMILIIMLCGCDVEENNTLKDEHKGKCLEYNTEYQLDCGLFTCSDSLCCERKYDVCIRWEE